MKKRVVGFGLLCLGLWTLGPGGVMASPPSALERVAQGGAPPAWWFSEPTLTTEWHTYRKHTKDYTFNIRYPVLRALQANDATTHWLWSVRSGIDHALEDQYKRFVQELQAYKAGGVSLPEGESICEGEVALVHQQGAVSLKMDVSTMYPGPAHPNSTVTTWVYPRHPFRGKSRMAITDLFQHPSLGLQNLAKLATEQLHKNPNYPPDAAFFDDGLTPKASNYAAFALRRDGLVIYFQDGQVLPHAAGIPQATVPWSKLDASLNAEARRLVGRL